MPIALAEADMSDRPSVHHAAADGFQAAAGVYQKSRPDYPAALAGWLNDELGLAPGRVVVDLGAGTGKFTPLLRATGARLVAVEPVEAMRAELVAAHPDVEALAGDAEHLPLADASVDAIVCAQSFHWFATPAALAEMRRALKPGGVLGLVWNVRDERVAWVAALTKILDRHQGDAPRHESGRWRNVFPFPGFTPLSERRFAHEHVGAAARVIVERAMSVSFIAALPADEQARVADEVRALIAATPSLAGRATVAFPYVTHAHACRRVE
jgi:SAM-dependent methyltransferase